MQINDKNIQSAISKYQNGNLQTIPNALLASTGDINQCIEDAIIATFDGMSGNTLTDDEKKAVGDTYIAAILNQLKDKESQDTLNEIYRNVLGYYEDGHIKDVFIVQALKKNGLPIPSSQCMYMPNDVIDSAKQYSLSKTPQNKEFFLANVGAFYQGTNAVHIAFDNDTEYQNWLSAVNTELTNAGQSAISNSIASCFNDGLILRASYDIGAQENDENSVARIVSKHVSMMSEKICTNNAESIIPTKIIVWNINKTARTTPSEITNNKSQIHQIDAAIDLSRILTFSQIASLMELEQDMNNIRQQTARFQQLLNNVQNAAASGKIKKQRYHMEQFNVNRVTKKIEKIMNKMKNQTMSKNIRYVFADSFSRPNRRDPDDINLPGKIVTEGFYPDIHVYVDTSGSISFEDYVNSVSLLGSIAKKFDCDLYFNSFTTDISQEVLVKCRNKTINQIRKEIEKIPKISGGTSIDQVWSYISATKKNRKQISIIISDFEVSIPNHLEHPRHLYYIPTKNASKGEVEYFMNGLDEPWRMMY